MAEDVAPGGDAGKKPKPERKKIPYTIIGAVGGEGAKLEDLTFRILGKIEAVTPGAAKEEILTKNPSFPDLKPGQPGGPDNPDGAAAPTDLQSLVRAKRLFLEAKSGFNPRQVEVDQPPPRFKGL